MPRCPSQRLTQHRLALHGHSFTPGAFWAGCATKLGTEPGKERKGKGKRHKLIAKGQERHEDSDSKVRKMQSIDGNRTKWSISGLESLLQRLEHISMRLRHQQPRAQRHLPAPGATMVMYLRTADGPGEFQPCPPLQLYYISPAGTDVGGVSGTVA